MSEVVAKNVCIKYPKKQQQIVAVAADLYWGNLETENHLLIQCFNMQPI